VATTRLTIERLGARGDGIATLDGKPVYVPYALPGEVVQVEPNPSGRRGEGMAAALVCIEQPSPERVEPPCRHFGFCGGCAAQHLADSEYRRWKAGQIEEALGRRGLHDVKVEPMAVTPPQRRRRASFTAQKTSGGTILGFHERASHRLVDLLECPVMLPQIEALIGPIRALLDKLPPGGPAQILVNATDTGLDIAVGARQPLDLAARETLARFVAAQSLARLSWDGEPVATRRAPSLKLGELTVEPPPGAFLQASVEGEEAMRDAILRWAGKARNLADLYGGVGTLSLPLVPARRVHLVEGDGAAVAAAAKAARQPAARSRLTVEQRDLARRPLAPDELARFDAVVFDPPRAGAEAQARDLAKSKVPVVVAVSCEPRTFARDASILIAGGYRLTKLTPVDQFAWSTHVELVGVFRR
jgi:23S rRNA (uracil1939-C5)-methyltransferase